MYNVRYIWILFAACLMACTSPTAEDYYRQGRASREQGDAVAAVEQFTAATRVPSREFTYKGRAYSNMATMCRMGERHDLAYALYEQSAKQFTLAKDTTAYAYALNNMAWEQAVQGYKKESSILADSALRISSAPEVYNRVTQTRAAAHLYAAEYDSVLFYTSLPMPEPAYKAILRAQAHYFLNHHDSALLYARQVIEATDNPRYLDDAYYIVTHCDNAADADEVRALAAMRTDIQQTLERSNPEWIQAMRLAEEALVPRKTSRLGMIALICATILLPVLVIFGLRRRRKKEPDIAQQCSLLKHSKNLKDELQWKDYTQFCAVCDEKLGGIATELQQRGLSEREIRMSVLIMIGLSYSQIADILCRAESGIGKDKYLIAKHLGVSVRELQTKLRELTCIFLLLFGVHVMASNNTISIPLRMVEYTMSIPHAPLDNPTGSTPDPTDPNQFRASLTGNTLLIETQTGQLSYVVINEQESEAKGEDYFVGYSYGSVSCPLTRAGIYTIRIGYWQTDFVGSISVKNLYVWDMSGKIIRTRTNDLNTLPPGVYIICLNTPIGNTSTKISILP